MRLAAGCRSVAAVGVNCVDPHHAAPLLRSAGEALLAACASREPPVLICYPNSGEGWDKQMRCWVEAPGVSEPAPFAAAAREWVAAGARMVGGCCRTTPEHIAELRRQLL
uniref:Hcy-binding domain-containing protein n=1 Tax=Chlamydomonas euryale TaxID=1486919 RepID=A0A7R9V9F6_9CHLO|mmetsp:Transcript_26819/g.79647  ORF Transcript_26819/g.79647 Transcript_26819/m.79647 type:complete len:110 (+) Transcript_26819:1216-1545(+)